MPASYPAQRSRKPSSTNETKSSFLNSSKNHRFGQVVHHFTPGEGCSCVFRPIPVEGKAEPAKFLDPIRIRLLVYVIKSALSDLGRCQETILLCRGLNSLTNVSAWRACEMFRNFATHSQIPRRARDHPLGRQVECLEIRSPFCETNFLAAAE